ncbi:hypothetical protein DFR50_10359 [Roseiarcus fermentans]|uniref:Uncharacterized protein n=1 Tax=Roseiarcus fermentans TaxID=1473586 RepID=A0A366FR62_9HYPH|nr:hypothetical protein DFR50_10359 [Roseiarcus fermentans]
MSQTLAEILERALEHTARPDSSRAFSQRLERDPARAPILPQVRESPENLGAMAARMEPPSTTLTPRSGDSTAEG